MVRHSGRRAALRRDDIGHLTPGAHADLALLDAPSHVHLAYRPGVPLIAGCGRQAAGRAAHHERRQPGLIDGKTSGAVENVRAPHRALEVFVSHRDAGRP